MLTPIVHEKLDKSFYALKICQMRWKCMQDMTPTFPYNLEKISYIYLPIYIPNLDNFLTSQFSTFLEDAINVFMGLVPKFIFFSKIENIHRISNKF